MSNPVRLAALASFIPAILLAQPQAASSAAVAAPSGVVKQTLSAGARAPICDGSEVRSFESRRQLGTVLVIGSLGIAAVGFTQVATSHGDQARAMHSAGLIGASLVPALIGGYLHWHSYPNESFWDSALAGMRTGETRIEDVRECLREPSAVSSAGSEEKLTYFTSRPLTLSSGGTFRAVSLTFQDSVLVEVRRSQIKLPAQPDVSTVPVIIPVP